MKILRIDECKAEFSTDGTDYKIVTDIGKEDIFLMLDVIMKEDIEIDSLGEDTIIHNPAEKIIYASLEEKFKSFMKEKERIASEITSTFEPLKSKMRNEAE